MLTLKTAQAVGNPEYITGVSLSGELTFKNFLAKTGVLIFMLQILKQKIYFKGNCSPLLLCISDG